MSASADVKAFEFSSKVKAGETVGGKFTVNGEEFTVRVLKDSSIAYLIAAINDTSDPMRTVTKVLDFLERALVKGDGARFEKLALDPDDGLTIEQILSVFQHVLTLSAGEAGPTGESSESSPSSPKTGAASRAKRASGA